jgi:hypothetical protein
MATLTLAQEFEVASIKPTATKDGSFTFDFPPGGRFTLRIAYRLEDYQISAGPSWSNSAGFDIQAKAPAGTGEVRQMLQALLADRFHLAVHPYVRLETGKGRVQEQLGLKLASTKGPIEILLIDHVEKPSEN